MGRRDQEIYKDKEDIAREQLFEDKLLEYIGPERGAQAALAKKLKLGRDHFNKMIHGERKMSFAVLRAFCNALDLDPLQTQELFELAGFHLVNPQTDPPPPPIPEFYMPHTEVLLAYLQYVIDMYGGTLLPNGRKILMERMYISLRAKEQKVTERMAEHTLDLDDMVTLHQAMQASTADAYATFATILKDIDQSPKTFPFDMQNRPHLFDNQKQQLPTLAEVIERHPSVVILGDPGSGKTMFGKWLMLQFARTLKRNDTQVYARIDQTRTGEEAAEGAKQVDLGTVRLPVFVSIAEYARAYWSKGEYGSELTLIEFLESGDHLNGLPKDLSQEKVGILVGEAIRQGQALIVLDGLDEIHNRMLRSSVMKAVQRFLQEWCVSERLQEEHPLPSERAKLRGPSGNRVIITSRIVGYYYAPLGAITHYTVEDMDDTSIRDFCHAWVRQVANSPESGEESTRQAERLQAAIFSQIHPGVRSMAGNPMLLSLIIQVYWNNRSGDSSHELPIRRVTLFDEAVRTFYDQRKTFWDRVGISHVRLSLAIGAVAAGLQAGGAVGLATEGEVRRHLLTVLDFAPADEVLSAAREVAGFLVERGEGIYGFLHRTIQEYFAAQYLVGWGQEMINNVVAHALDPIWREPVVLAVGIVSRPQHPLHDRLPDLFRALLDIPDPAGAFLPRRELLFVVACTECERIPAEASKTIAENLLTFYVKSKGSGRSQLLSEPILRAFTSLQNTLAAVETEGVLCSAVGANDVERRYGAIDLVMRIKWYSPAIVRSLIDAWYTYLSPAELFLMAIETIYKHYPHYLQNESNNLLPSLLPTLTGEDVNTAYAVTQLLATLASTNASTIASVHEQIIEALVNALNDPGSQRKVVIAGESKGTLEDAFSTALLQVTGWAG